MAGCSRSGLGLDESLRAGPPPPTGPRGEAGSEPPIPADPADPVDPADPADPADTGGLPPGCVEEDLTIHVLSDDAVLYSFDPLNVKVTPIGRVDCAGAELNSMSISRGGNAFVAAQDGRLFRVDLETLVCTETPFDPTTLLGEKFGLGFVADADMDETLYIVEERHDTRTAVRLSAIDLVDFQLAPVGLFPPGTPSTEITGTGDGRIFGLVISLGIDPPRLTEIDRQTVEVTDIGFVPFGQEVYAFDFAFWGGAFYIFLADAPAVGSSVIRIAHPGGAPETLGAVTPRIIGAGTSVCARQ